jgi:hypothetical protein
MSIKLSNRIKRVATELKRKHPCSICHGKGKWVVSYLHEGEPEPLKPVGCEGCGEVSHIIVNYVRVEKIER